MRERLAAEYVLGTLRGPARARLRSLMRYDPGLRRAVLEWEERRLPLAAALPEIAPPPRLWRALSRRIGAGGPRARALAFWRGLALAAGALALLLALVVGLAPRAEPPISMIAVMMDENARPALVASWLPMRAMREPQLRIRVVQEHPTMAPGTSWELWLLPPGGAAPVSLGLITTEPEQVLPLRPELLHDIEGAWGMAMSVEPEGGSPTGAPTGPLLFKGPCVRIL